MADLYAQKQTAVVYGEGPTRSPDAFAFVRVHVDYHLNHTVEWKLKESVTDRLGLFEVELFVDGQYKSISDKIDGLFVQIEPGKIPLGRREAMKVRVRYHGYYGVYVSRDIPVIPSVTKADRGIACQMIHRQYLTLKGYSGTKGLLLKRRLTGSECSLCANTSLGVSGNYSCLECFGTGFTGGFYPGVELYIEIHAAGNPLIVTDPSLGDMEPANITQAITAHEHWIEKGDLWVSDLTGDRFVIQEMAPGAMYKGFIISMSIALRKEDLSVVGGKATEMNNAFPIEMPAAFE